MSITATERTQIVELAVLMFNAAPGATYLSQLVSMYEANGHNLQALAVTLAATPAYQTLNPNFQLASDFATAFLTPLGLQADSVAVAFVTSKFNAGESKGQIAFEAFTALNAITSANGIQYQNAKAILLNKTQVAEYYSEVKAVAETNLGALQNVLSTITADPATVTAEIAALNVVPPQTFNLTTGVDVVHAEVGANSIVTGTADTAGTFTTGDIITGNATTVFNLALNGTPTSLATVTNVGTVNLNAVASTTVNADLWSGITAINVVTPTIAGTTTTLSNAQVASTIGDYSGNQANITVTYRDTAGSADTAHVALGGTGISSAASTIDVSSGNTVEGLALVTSGTNFATVNPGTADKTITITGAGVNTLTFGATAATLTVDASAATAVQKLTFASGSIGAEDTILGGTAADTVTANGATTFAHMTGVETFVTTVNGGVGIFDGANVSGLTTMTINQGTSAGAEFFTNMKAEFSTLNINGPTLTQEVDYVTGANATLNLTYGAGTASDTSFDGLTVSNVKTLNVTFNEGGVAANDMTVLGDITLDKSATTGLTLIQAGSDDTFTTYLTVARADSLDNVVIRATGDNSSVGATFTFHADHAVQGLQTIEITASGVSSSAYFEGWEHNNWSTSGSGATYSITSTTNAMSLTSFAVTASGQDSSAYMYTAVDSVGHMSTYTITASGNNTDAENDYQFVNVGAVDTFTVTASGAGAYAAQDSAVTVTDGNIGTISLIASAHSSTASMDYEFFVARGDIGTVNLTASGASSSAYLYWIDSYAGNVGTVNITASGASSSASLEYLYVNTGDVGALNITASGASSSAGMYDLSVYGNVGNIAVTASGNSSSAYLEYLYVTSGDVSSISLVASGDYAEAYGYTYSVYTGDVGSWSLLASGAGASVWQEFQYVGGSVGTMSIVASGATSDAYLDTYLSVTGDVGSLTVTASGQSASADFTGYYMTVGGNLGSVNVTASGSSAWASAYAYVSGNVNSASVTASGGDSEAEVQLYNNDGNMSLLSLVVAATGAGASAYAYVDTGAGVMGNVTMSATKANSTAYLDFTGNSFGTITSTSGAPSATVDMYLDNTTSAGGSITASGSGQLYIDIQEKSITSLSASGETNKVTVVVDLPYTKATAGMTLTTGSAADNVMGGAGVDTFNLGAGADIFNFTNLQTESATVLSAVTDIIAGGFASGSDKLEFSLTAGYAAGSGSNYTENLTAAASLTALITAADTALNGTFKYYFGVVGTDGYLATDVDGTGVTNLIKLTGIVDMAPTDITAA